jgi:hypothetical protein
MPYTTISDGDVKTASYWNANLRDQVVSTVTSATRPAGTEGQVIYETDTDLVYIYSGSGWVLYGGIGAWTTYAPSVVQSGTVTHTDSYARYFKIGRLVAVNLVLDITGTGTANAVVYVSLPFTAAVNNTNMTIGNGYIRDASAGFKYFGLAVLASTTSMALLEIAQGTDRQLGFTGASFSAALAAGDFISMQATYEANA